MIAPATSLDALDAFERRRQTETFTGSLLGLSLPERDRLLAAEFERFEADLAVAREQAARSGQPVEIDGARLSLTASGDRWIVSPDGRLGREFSHFEGFETLLARVGSPLPLDPSRAVDPEARLTAAYHGFWSPSATNWQPTRVLEIEGPRKARFAEIAGWEKDLVPAVWVVLRRDHYESLLGDVLEPFGLEVTAREESIDAGIFVHTAAMAAVAQGLTYRDHLLDSDQIRAVGLLLEAELGDRLGILGASEREARERRKITALQEDLRLGRYLPDSLVVLGHPRADGGSFDRFEELIEAHSTQRVASPSRDLGPEVIAALWSGAMSSLPDFERRHVTATFFDWHQKTPAAIGQAMFEALYGQGADPETKTGGTGGLLTAVNVREYLRYQNGREAAARPELPDGWQALSETELAKAARAMPVRTRDLGPFLLERILRDGKYRAEDGVIVDANGKPLSVPVLVRLARALGATFGNFFLKFQNTHPQNAVLLADVASGEPHAVHRSVGKVGAALTFQARALGLSSILKTGPIDLARAPIGHILAKNLDGVPELALLHDALEGGAVRPAMTFQVGYPLAGSDVVDAGTPHEHSGLEERRRDKRPPRARFSDHILPDPAPLS